MDPLEKALDPRKPIRVAPRVDRERLLWGLSCLAFVNVGVSGAIAAGAAFPVYVVTLLAPPLGIICALMVLAVHAAINVGGVRFITGRRRIWTSVMGVVIGFVITAVIVIAGYDFGAGHLRQDGALLVRAAVPGGLTTTAAVALGMPWRSREPAARRAATRAPGEGTLL